MSGPMFRPRSSLGRRRLIPTGSVSERNVRLSLSLAVLGALVHTIAHGHLFTAFVFEIFGDNSSVGLLDSAAGFTGLVCAIPVGLAVDKVSRTKLLRICAVIGLLAAATGATAVVYGPYSLGDVDEFGKRQPPVFQFKALLMLSLCLWGIFFSTTASTALAVFADSVPAESREKRLELYALKSTLQALALAAGPLVALVSNVCYGNTWKLTTMSYALLPGFLLMPVMSILLAFFEEVEVPASVPEVELGDKQGENGEGRLSDDPLKRPGAAMVPYLLLAAELITSVGAGMTVKFFGLWFKNVFQFTPAGLALLSACTPVAMAVSVQALNWAARVCPLGPVPAVLAFWLSSIACLLAMVQVTDWRVLVILHLLRTALANSKEPLARSILADFVPSNQRGRWNAVHSLTGMTWTGSAALGGILCDRYGYGRTFHFTAVLYVVAALFWLPLVRLVPPEKPKDRDAGREERVKGA